MKIKSIHLHDYKRFTDLQIVDLPPEARLVVMIGPNGIGKSSLFDAFLFKSQHEPMRGNYNVNESQQEYYFKAKVQQGNRSATQNIWEQITIKFHDDAPMQGKWQQAFNVRSPYRNEPEFKVDSLSEVAPASENPRFKRIIDSDAAVSDDYRRLAWKRMTDVDSGASDSTTFGEYRSRSLRELQDAISSIFPALALQDFGGITGGGGFRFSKGIVKDFHYKNLSGGEKAAFDLLLDVFVKREEYHQAIYCIDEPEAHTAVGIQGQLLDALLALLPHNCQLWIATHSIGFIRAAYQRSQKLNDVAFLDFANHDFDNAVTLTPAVTSREFWRNTYEVALDDLATLVGPSRIVLCEGKRDRPSEGFDAQCYSKIFEHTHGDTMFLSRGGSNQVEQSEHLQAIIKEILKGAQILRLRDRDDMADDQRKEAIEGSNLRVLSRRELENYLYDPEVILTFFKTHGHTDIPANIRQLLVDDPITGDIKQISFQVLNATKAAIPSQFLGNNRQQFELSHLVPALMNTQSILGELEHDVFQGGQ